MQVVILHQFAPTDVELFAQELESIAVAGHNVGNVVGNIHLMRVGKPGFLLQFFLPLAGLALAHAAAVVLIQVVVLDNGYQAVGIGRVCGVSRFFQAARPAFVVGNLQLKQESIACAAFQEERVILVGVLRVAIGAEALSFGIVVVVHSPPAPVAMALYAEVVVALACQCALSRTALQQALCQCDAGGYLMFLHLLHGKRGILFDIFVVTGISALCLHSHANKEKCYDSSQSEYRFHASSVEFDTKVCKRIEKTNLFPIFVTLITINHYSMKDLNIQIAIKIYEYEELNAADRELLDAARQATYRSYAPYSHFSVGAAARLANNIIVTGTNQENAAYPSGLCAERTTLFYANSQYPDQAVETLAIAARNERGDFLEEPIPPCGACRQVMLETEKRFKRPMRILLSGEKGIYELRSVGALLPLSFDASSML